VDIFTGIGSKPRRLAVAPDGALWVSLYGTGKLMKIDTAAGRKDKEYPLPDGSNSGPYSVNIDALGRVWVALFQKDSVAILDPKTEKFRIIRLPDKNSGIRNATIDGQGRYWFVCTATGKLGVIE
jgi:virginiamycin B lyase